MTAYIVQETTLYRVEAASATEAYNLFTESPCRDKYCIGVEERSVWADDDDPGDSTCSRCDAECSGHA